MIYQSKTIQRICFQCKKVNNADTYICPSCNGTSNIPIGHKPIDTKKGSLRNVGVVKSICKQVQTAAYQCSNHGISATGGFISHGYSFSGTEYLLSIDLRMCPMQSI